MGLSIEFESPALSGRFFTVFAIACISGHVSCDEKVGDGADPNILN